MEHMLIPSVVVHVQGAAVKGKNIKIKGKIGASSNYKISQNLLKLNDRRVTLYVALTFTVIPILPILKELVHLQVNPRLLNVVCSFHVY